MSRTRDAVTRALLRPLTVKVTAPTISAVATVPLAEIAHQDGTPRFGFLQEANRAFNDVEARNADNPSYEPYPAGAHRHLGLIAEAVLAERAAIREVVASAMAAPGPSPEVRRGHPDYRADAGRGVARGDRPRDGSAPRAGRLGPLAPHGPADDRGRRW